MESTTVAGNQCRPNHLTEEVGVKDAVTKEPTEAQHLDDPNLQKTVADADTDDGLDVEHGSFHTFGTEKKSMA